MIRTLTQSKENTRHAIIPLLVVALLSTSTTLLAGEILFVSDSETDAINIPAVLSGQDPADPESEFDPPIPNTTYRAAVSGDFHNVTIIRNDYAVTGGSFGEAEGTNLALLGDLFPYCSVFWSASGPHEPLGLFPDRITNGDFENIGGTHGGGVIFVPAEDPSTVLTGWTVDMPVNWDFDPGTSPVNDASSGGGFVDLTPTGQISQMLNTEAGQMYMLSIDRKGDGSFVSLNGSYLVLTAGETSGNWTTFTAMFMAPTTMTSLVISGTSAGENAIDNIRFAPYPQTPGLGADGGLHIDPDVIANLDYYVLNGGFLFVTGHDAITHPPSAPAASDGPLVKFLGGAGASAGQTVNPSYTALANDSALGIGFPAAAPPVGGMNQIDGVHEQDYLSGIDGATTPLVTGPGGAYWTARSPYGNGVDDDDTDDGVDLTDGHIAYVANGVFFYDTDPVDESGATIDTDPLSDGEDPTWLNPLYKTALLNFAANSCASAAAAETPTAHDQSVSTDVNTPIVITLTGFDPNGDPLTYAIDTGPLSGVLGPLVGDTVTYTPNPGFVGNDSFKFTVADDDGNVSPPATVSIEVLPTPPLTVDAGPDVFIDEGSGDSFSSAGGFTDPDPSGPAPWDATVDYGAGGGDVALPLAGQTFSLANTYPTDDDAIFVVTVTVTDTGDGDTDSDTAVVFIQNVPPTVFAGPDGTISEGETFASSGYFDDVAADTHTVEVDYGDGSSPDVSAPLAGDAFALDHTYSIAGEYTVTVTVTDDDGGIGIDTVTVTVVENVAPEVAADNATVTVNEGQAAGNTGTYSDANGDDVSITASIGTVTKTGTSSGTWSWTYTPPDGPDDSQTVTITADDGEGGVTTTTFDLIVDNVAPTVAADNDPVTVNEGATATNTGTFSDPGLDIVTISASVGTITQSGTQSGTWSWSYGTVDGPDDSQVVTITAMDDDGASSTTTFALNVNNVAPTVAADNDPVTVPEGSTATNTGTFSDPGLDVVTISASVGTISQSGSQSGTWSWSYPTTDNVDSQTVTVTATDSDGAFSETTFDLNVLNVAPTVAADNDPVTVNEGDTATNTGTFSDPGLDVVSISASVGTVSQTGSQSGTWSWSFGTQDGPADSQTVTIIALDDDGASSTTTFTLNVNNVAPTVAADNDPVTVNEGDTATNTGTFSDPGLDIVTISASVGTVSQIGSQSGTWSWSYGTVDGPDDSQVVTITATDDDGDFSTATFNLIVNNVAPSVAADNDSVTVPEGGAATNTGTFSDPGLDAVSISASIGTVSQIGSQSGTWSWSVGTPDGPATEVVTITATDSDGAFSTTTFDLIVLNVPPVANDDAYGTDEDVELIVGSPGVLANDTDVGDDALTASVTTDPSNGTLSLNGDGSFTYTPDLNWFGTDTFVYTATDDDGATDTATVTIEVEPVNDPPTLTVDIATQTVQYSDGISPVTITAADVDNVLPPLSLSYSALPAGLSVSAGACVLDNPFPPGEGSICTWTLSGNIGEGAGNYPITFTVDETPGVPGGLTASTGTSVTVVQEDASVAFDEANAVAVMVTEPGGSSPMFSLTTLVTETFPDLAANDLTAPGDIQLANVAMVLTPVGPGGSVSPTSCTASTAGTGYDRVQTVTCSFIGVSVNTYSVDVTVAGDYYTGFGDDVFTVYDPSLGFTTGGGWFYWPGTDDKTNFGYTMKYGKNGRNVKGSLLIMRHMGDGTKYRFKSNALEGLAVGETGTFGWASFAGKGTYLEPGWPDPIGNHTFTVYVEDHGEPGAGADRLWIETRDKDGNVLPGLTIGPDATGDAETIDGGNIVVPHTNSGTNN